MAAIVDLDPPQVPQPSMGLRAHAELRYVTGGDLSLSQLLEEEPFKSSGLHPRTVERWSTEDRWGEQREAFQKNLKAKLLREMGDDLVEQQKRMLHQLQEMHDAAIQKLKSGSVRPRSFEGMLNAISRCAEVLTSLRSKLLDDIRPDFPAATYVDQTPVPKLTFEEARAAAKLLIKMRMEALGRAATESNDEALREPERRKKNPPPTA